MNNLDDPFGSVINSNALTTMAKFVPSSVSRYGTHEENERVHEPSEDGQSGSRADYGVTVADLGDLEFLVKTKAGMLGKMLWGGTGPASALTTAVVGDSLGYMRVCSPLVSVPCGAPLLSAFDVSNELFFRGSLGQIGKVADLVVKHLTAGSSSVSLEENLLSNYLAAAIQFSAHSCELQIADVKPFEDLDRAASMVLDLTKGFPTPHLSTSDEGEKAFFWFSDGDAVDAYLHPDGYFTWIGRFGGQYIRGGDEIWQGTIPQEFLGMLTRLYP